MTAQITLSYSSSKTVKACEQKYFHYKVAQTPKDADYEESDALSIGKAFHKVLELTKHESYSDKLIMAAMQEFGVDRFERELLTAMLDGYVKVHKLSGLKVVHCELPIQTDVFVGFIDFIAQSENGWWIGDNKTASRHDPGLLPRLHKDVQINLYSHFAPEIAHMLKLKGPFLGFRYRQTIKSKAKTAKGLANGTPTYDIEIPAGILDPDGTWSSFLETHKRATELHNGEAPTKNLGACFDYFRPCEYFSQCHGCLHSEGNPAITVHTLESLEDSDLL